jgi:hypothetical protein
MVFETEKSSSLSINTNDICRSKRNEIELELDTTCRNTVLGTNHLNYLDCFYTNATSLANKWDEFKLVLEYHNKPHIVMVSETWFNIRTLKEVNGYQLFAKDREQIRGGGVAIYVRNDLTCNELNLGTIRNGEQVEQIWCSVNLDKERIAVGCIYRPPTARRETSVAINESLKKAKSLVDSGSFSSLLISGDFNYQKIIWNHGEWKFKGRRCPLSIEFVETLEANFLHQHVSTPTFGKNFLDLVITDDPVRVQNTIIGPPLSSSKDNRLHSTIRWKFLVQSKESKPIAERVVRLYYKGNYHRVGGTMREACKGIRSNMDPQRISDVICSAYRVAIEEHVPIKTKQGITSYNIDIAVKKDRTVKEAIKNKYRLFARTKSKSIESAETRKEYKKEYNRASREVKKCVKRVREDLEYKIAAKCKHEPKLLYSYINGQKKIKDSIRALKLENGSLAVDRLAIANTLNLQFQRAFTKIGADEHVSKLAIRTKEICRLDPSVLFSPENIQKYLDKLNKSKTPGNDNIHPHVLREASSDFATILSKLFIRSYESGELPMEWKEANVTPIYKKGPRSDPGNYRPVSLTSIVCKIMERMIRDVMMAHLIENNLIYKGQHGFVPGKACTTNLLETLDTITDAMSKGYLVILILLDFAKAFDTVPHDELVGKARAYGFGEDLLRWLSNFLKNRRQRVVMGETITEWLEVFSGVPQGSVLGPLLFIIYINDMPDGVINHLKLFADDSKLISVIKNEDDWVQLQQDLDRISEWSIDWKMSFNYNKCKFMRFGNLMLNRPDLSLTMKASDGIRHVLEESNGERDLGVCLQNNLKWSDNVNKACSSAYNSLGLLRKTFRTWTNIRTFKTLYTAFVRPHLEYAPQVWNSLTSRDVKKLEKVQKSATKLVPQLRNLRYRERLLNLGLTTLADRRTRGDLIQMFKIDSRKNSIELIGPVMSCNIENSEPNDGPASSVTARRRKSLRVVKELVKGCSVRDKFFSNRVVDSWNALNNEIVSSSSVNEFKKRYDSYIKQTN